MKYELTARNFRPYVRNTLQGFVDIHFDRAGILLKECTYHVGDGKSWIGLPGKPQLVEGQVRKDGNGKIMYVPVVELTTGEAREAFRRDAVAAVERIVATADA